MKDYLVRQLNEYLEIKVLDNDEDFLETLEELIIQIKSNGTTVSEEEISDYFIDVIYKLKTNG
jgi:hypothetical protein